MNQNPGEILDYGDDFVFIDNEDDVDDDDADAESVDSQSTESYEIDEDKDDDTKSAESLGDVSGPFPIPLEITHQAANRYIRLEREMNSFKLTRHTEVAIVIGLLIGIVKYQLLSPFVINCICAALMLYLIDTYVEVEQRFFQRELSPTMHRFSLYDEEILPEHGTHYPYKLRDWIFGTGGPYFALFYHRANTKPYTYWLFNAYEDGVWFSQTKTLILEVRHAHTNRILRQYRVGSQLHLAIDTA